MLLATRGGAFDSGRRFVCKATALFSQQQSHVPKAVDGLLVQGFLEKQAEDGISPNKLGHASSKFTT